MKYIKCIKCGNKITEQDKECEENGLELFDKYIKRAIIYKCKKCQLTYRAGEFDFLLLAQNKKSPFGGW